MTPQPQISSASVAPSVAPDELLDALRKCKRPCIFSHVNPDGDAIGSELALFHGLRALGAEPRVFNAQPAPETFKFLSADSWIDVVPPESEPARLQPIAEADLLIVVDTSEPDRIGHFEEAVWAAPARRCVIDHHLCDRPEVFDVVWSDTRSPSTGNLILQLLDQLEVPVTQEIAEALFVAIATDTGWFHHGNTTPEALRAAARLVEAGSSPERIHQQIYETSSLERMRLFGEVLRGMQVGLDGRVVYYVLSREQLDQSGVSSSQLDGFIDGLRGVKGGQIVFLAVELSPGRYKVSLRSRRPLSIHPIAAQFGGGGHAQASGCRIEGDESSVVSRLLQASETVLREAEASSAGG